MHCQHFGFKSSFLNNLPEIIDLSRVTWSHRRHTIQGHWVATNYTLSPTCTSGDTLNVAVEHFSSEQDTTDMMVLDAQHQIPRRRFQPGPAIPWLPWTWWLQEHKPFFILYRIDARSAPGGQVTVGESIGRRICFNTVNAQHIPTSRSWEIHAFSVS